MESKSCFQELFAYSGDRNTKSTSRESAGVQEVVFIILGDVWLDLEKLTKLSKQFCIS